jgi:hypothetical protein
MSELALQMFNISIETGQIMFVVTEVLLGAGLARCIQPWLLTRIVP